MTQRWFLATNLRQGYLALTGPGLSFKLLPPAPETGHPKRGVFIRWRGWHWRR